MASPVRATWRAAVSPLIADVVTSRGEGRVLGVFPTCVYLGFDDHATVVALLARDALQLPIGMCLTASSREISWGLASGDRVQVGGGVVRLPRVDVVAAREQRPSRVLTGVRTAATPLGRAWATMLPDSVQSDLADRATEVAATALAGAPVTALLTNLIGSGPGLTPSGDDVLSGALLTLRSAGELAAVDRLDRAMEPLLPATTSLSAALLRAAAAGYAAPEVVALVDLLARGPEPMDHHDMGVSPGPSTPATTSAIPWQSIGSALERVLAIGHTSGSDLVAGIAGATRALHPALEPRPKEALHA